MISDTHLRVEGGGSAAPLVLLHGVGLDLTMWDGVVDALAADRKVVRYDLLGHGHSADPPGERSIADFLVQLLEVVDTVGLGPPDIAGLSMGGMISLAAAARHPSAFRRVALLNTVFCRTPEQVAGSRERLAMAAADGMGAVADLAIDRWFSADWQATHPGDTAVVREHIQGNDLAAYLKAYRVFVEGDPLMPEGAANVTAPTLAMTGELDPGSTPAMSHALAEAVPHGQAVVLAGLHHLPPIEAPGAFLRPFLDFLDQEHPA